jgi:glycosyltransferase involved in cell wall biosynthesis
VQKLNVSSRSNTRASIDSFRMVLAGWGGALIHYLVGWVRRAVATTTEADPSQIAVLCDPFLRYGAAQAVGLKQTGMDVTLYFVDRSHEFGDNEDERSLMLAQVEAAGVALVRLPRRRIRSLVRDTLWLHMDLRRRKIAAAVVQWHYDPRYATLGLALPVALIVHDPQPHSGDFLSEFPLPVRLISRTAELTAACLIIHSSRLFDQVRPLLRRLPIGVVPHGADMAPRPTPIPETRRLLIFGRLFAYKGVDTALDAFKLLPKEMSDVKLIVAGRGPLADLARNQHNVELRDRYIDDSELDALLDDVRLVLLPYTDATQSGVGLQAIARGVPCVVSSTGGLPELVEDSSSRLVVPPCDARRLADAIISTIDHHAELRSAIHGHAAAHFAWPIVAQALRFELSRLEVVNTVPAPYSRAQADAGRNTPVSL